MEGKKFNCKFFSIIVLGSQFVSVLSEFLNYINLLMFILLLLFSK